MTFLEAIFWAAAGLALVAWCASVDAGRADT